MKTCTIFTAPLLMAKAPGDLKMQSLLCASPANQPTRSDQPSNGNEPARMSRYCELTVSGIKAVKVKQATTLATIAKVRFVCLIPSCWSCSLTLSKQKKAAAKRKLPTCTCEGTDTEDVTSFNSCTNQQWCS